MWVKYVLNAEDAEGTMMNKTARALGLRKVKSLAKVTQLSKQWNWNVPLQNLSSHPPHCRSGLPGLPVLFCFFPLLFPHVDTSRVFGG